MFSVSRTSLIIGGISLVVLPLMVTPVMAVTNDGSLKACERKVCGLIVNRRSYELNMSCNLSKTWSKREIVRNARKVDMNWSWGDVHCSASATMPTRPMLAALEDAEGKVKGTRTLITCQIKPDSDGEPLTFYAAPTVFLKDGVVTNVKFGISEVKGPFLQRMTIKAATLLEYSGFVKNAAVKSINKFMRRCPSKIR